MKYLWDIFTENITVTCCYHLLARVLQTCKKFFWQKNWRSRAAFLTSSSFLFCFFALQPSTRHSLASALDELFEWGRRDLDRPGNNSSLIQHCCVFSVFSRFECNKYWGSCSLKWPSVQIMIMQSGDKRCCHSLLGLFVFWTQNSPNV